MALAKSQRSLKSWTKQKWRTKSGKPGAKTGERYLPTAAIKAGGKGGAPGQWSARKAQLLASRYKKGGGGYK